ncbi:sn-glycerol-3-phosphate ABC transporter ATP-binding protein UgpC [Acuticoccus sp. MNP-M23]|uniref:ABC transporter ATP-binding protein n=1 Tax=Acuticoccus sp. MNP-M23 TaxID=3072793 RepID=UPI0028168ED0|nr:sn-glycerol-3-phosphate ABC transporter ATP-binding protein UgpC [Acuticoccus sp. MNP-M23]WMS44937.1 sn-glycerol-3-phosphate ABC transporter ATP-binding protein UgpC [Acuticoccus sp. MNP-M23]
MGRIQLNGITKEFGSVKVLHGIDLEVEEGELIVFVGPSGCGKSTLLRLISGLDRPTAGEILIDGKDVTTVNAADRGLAMVFQSYALYPHMSVWQNMAFGLQNEHLPKAEIRERIAEAARLLEIEPLLERRPGQLSGGQRQRVAIGRAIVREPTAFLLDEPLSNLDAELRVSMRAELAALHARLGKTMIYVTHDQIEAMTLASRIVVLRAGRIEQVATPLDLFNAPVNRFVAGFIGAPTMNLLPGRIEGNGEAGARLSFVGDAHVDVPLRRALREGEAVTVGIRPQHMRLVDAADARAVHATVTLVEALGTETVVHARTPSGALLLAVLPGQAKVARGDAIALGYDAADVHVFDGEDLSVTARTA